MSFENELIRLSSSAEAEKRPLMFFFGVGDHGGGPTRAAIEALRALEQSDAGSVVFSTPAHYFDVALGAGSMPLETVDGDLHMHAVGCYSVVSWMKALNARSERALVEAERLAALAGLATGQPLNVNEELASAWERVLFNQFHDSLGGTCTAEVHDQLREFYGYALTIADDVATRATQAVSTRADTWVEEAAQRRPVPFSHSVRGALPGTGRGVQPPVMGRARPGGAPAPGRDSHKRWPPAGRGTANSVGRRDPLCHSSVDVCGPASRRVPACSGSTNGARSTRPAVTPLKCKREWPRRRRTSAMAWSTSTSTPALAR